MSHAVKNPNVTKAVSRMVKAYRQRSGDDREEIALDLGMQLSTFQNKLKVAHINDFTPGELLALTELTRALRELRGMERKIEVMLEKYRKGE